MADLRMNSGQSSRRSLQFRLSFVFLTISAAGILLAIGRVLGLPFVFYMIGFLGVLATPAFFHSTRSRPWQTAVAILAGFAWFSAWLLLARWAIRFG